MRSVLSRHHDNLKEKSWGSMCKAAVCKRANAALLLIKQLPENNMYSFIYPESNNFDQLANGVLDKLPVALNSLAFELETLRKISKDYTSNISLAQHYQQLSL